MNVKCPSCKYGFTSNVNLGDLEIKHMENPELRTYEVTIRNEVYKWHVLTTEDEIWLEKQKKEVRDDNKSTLAVLSRLDAINGKSLNRDKQTLQLLKYLKEIPSAVMEELRNHFLETEGDIDTKLEFVCPECDFEFYSYLEINEGFFSRSATLTH